MVDNEGLGSKYVGGGSESLEEKDLFDIWVISCWRENELFGRCLGLLELFKRVRFTVL